VGTLTAEAALVLEARTPNKGLQKSNERIQSNYKSIGSLNQPFSQKRL
jgi:hypothetical protein